MIEFMIWKFDEMELIGSILIGVAISILIFYIIREILTWYWKITEIVNLLTKIHNHLVDIKIEIEKNKRY